MTTLVEFTIIASADNRPPMLEKSLYDSWKTRMELYMENRENGRLILDSVLNGPLVWPTVDQEDGTTRKKTYAELFATKKIQADCDLKATNIVLQDDPIACLNKAMAFLTAVASLKFPSTNNQLRTSLNPRNQATIQDGRVTVQQIQGRQGQSYAGIGYNGNATSFGGNNTDRQERAVKCYNCQYPSILDSQAAQTTILNNAAFQTEDLDAYDFDCDDVSNAKAVLMANLSKYGYDVISKLPHFEPYHNDMDNQSVHATQDFKQTPVLDFSDNKITSDSNIIPYSQYFTREKMIDSQMDDMIKEKLTLKQQIDSLEQNISNQIKEKESLLQTFTVFKNESKEKESKYMENEIDLEKKTKELDNIIYKKAQWIKPTLYDGSVISSQLVAIPVIDEEETLILEELNHLSEDFGKRFVPQQELFAEQAFWLQTSNPNTKQSDITPGRIEVPSELPKIFKDQFDSIKKTCVRSKEHSDSLIAQLNSKSIENADLKAQIQDKVFVITSLKNDLRKLKGKEIIDNAAQIPSAITIVPGMFKLDLDPLAPRLLKNREAHIEYLKHTQEQADVLWGIELLVYVRDTCPNAYEIDCCHTYEQVKKVRSSEPLTSSSNIKQVVQIVLWNMDSGCSKHMTGNRSQLMNFVSKFLGTVRFRNDQIAKIMGFKGVISGWEPRGDVEDGFCVFPLFDTKLLNLIMPPKMMKRKAVKKIVKKRIAKAIEEYEKTRANLGNAGGSGPANTGGTVNVQGCSHKTFMNGKPHPFNGMKGVVGLRRWIEKVEQVFEICKCAEEDKVMFAASTFEGRALTWWNGNVHTYSLD
ncbi:hypothetical protein Tco_0289907 [Tanacetum coccineum]